MDNWHLGCYSSHLRRRGSNMSRFWIFFPWMLDTTLHLDRARYVDRSTRDANLRGCAPGGHRSSSSWSRSSWPVEHEAALLEFSALIPHPGFTKPLGTGPIWPVTGQTGPGRFRFGPVSNWPKFKIQIWIQKNEKFLKNTSRCDESNDVKFSQKFVHLV